MMSHRFAMERGKILAAFGCHGGELSWYPTDQATMDADKAEYDIQPMPAQLTIGDLDVWYTGANASFDAWKYWNQCADVNVDDSGAHFNEHIASSCANYTPALETQKLVVKGGFHIWDPQSSERSYHFMKAYSRPGALAELPEAVPEVVPSPDDWAQRCDSAFWLVLLLLASLVISVEV